MLELRNPHSVLAAIEHRPVDVLEIRVGNERPQGAWKTVVERAQHLRIPIGVLRHAPDRSRKKQGGKSERPGIAAGMVKEHAGVRNPDELFAQANESENDRPGLWLALDQLQDPQNVGAVFRTAAFFGVKGIVVTRDRSAPLNATVHDVSAGGVECTPFCVVPNLARVLDSAKEAGLWTLGTSEHSDEPLEQIQADRPWLLIVGNEEKGLRRLTLDSCDQLCGIQPHGGVTSLNVSAATAVMISHLTRRV